MSSIRYIEPRTNPEYKYDSVLEDINYNFGLLTGGTSSIEAYLSLSGGTVTGNTFFTQNLTANTFDANIIMSGGTDLSDLFSSIEGLFWSAGTGLNSIIQKGGDNDASGIFSFSQGTGTTASGDYSYSEGWMTTAAGNFSHAEGYQTEANGTRSHAEGYQTIVNGQDSHAEGGFTLAQSNYTHAEGWSTNATNTFAHSQNSYTIANGRSSHAGGSGVNISTDASVANGNTSFIHFKKTITNGKTGAYADFSAILGGLNQHIEAGADTSIILGGDGNYIESTASGSTILGGQYITATTENSIYTQNARLAENSGVIYSAGTDLYNIFSTSSVSVQGGINISTGGTSGVPIINLEDDIILNSISASTMSAQTIHVSNLSGFSPININNIITVGTALSGKTIFGNTSIIATPGEHQVNISSLNADNYFLIENRDRGVTHAEVFSISETSSDTEAVLNSRIGTSKLHITRDNTSGLYIDANYTSGVAGIISEGGSTTALAIGFDSLQPTGSGTADLGTINRPWGEFFVDRKVWNMTQRQDSASSIIVNLGRLNDTVNGVGYSIYSPNDTDYQNTNYFSIAGVDTVFTVAPKGRVGIGLGGIKTIPTQPQAMLHVKSTGDTIGVVFKLEDSGSTTVFSVDNSGTTYANTVSALEYYGNASGLTDISISGVTGLESRLVNVENLFSININFEVVEEFNFIAPYNFVIDTITGTTAFSAVSIYNTTLSSSATTGTTINQYDSLIISSSTIGLVVLNSEKL